MNVCTNQISIVCYVKANCTVIIVTRNRYL